MNICARRVLIVRTLLSAGVVLAATIIAFRLEAAPLASLASIVASIASIGAWTLNALISIAVIALLTRSLITATAMAAWLLELSFNKPGATFLVILTAASWLVVALPLAFLASVRGGLGDPLLDERSWKRIPFLTPIPLGLLLALVVVDSLEVAGPPMLLHLAFTSAGSVVVALYSGSIVEALALGAVSSLGPLGFVLIGSRVSFSYIDPGGCSGIVLGRLVSIEDSGARVKMATGGGSFFAVKSVGPLCTVSSKAILALGRRPIIWVYGRAPRSMIDSITPKPALVIKVGENADDTDLEEILSETSAIIASGGTATVTIDPTRAQVAIGVAEFFIEAASSSGAKAVIIEAGGLEEEVLKRIVEAATRKSRHVVVTLNSIPWTGPSLMPRFHADSSGIIAIELEDPGDKAKIVSTLFSSSEARTLARRILATREYGVGYPYCGGKPFIFRVEYQ